MTNSKTTILIVDDDEVLTEAIAFDYRRKDFKVLTASSGNEAFSIVQKGGVDLVLTDVRMPDGDGIQLLERVHALGPNAPKVILITGFSDLTSAEAFAKGASAVFPKPFDRQKLFSEVMRLVAS